MNRAERRRAKRGRSHGYPSTDLAQAIGRHRARDLRGVEATYLARLGEEANDADALHFLGVLRHQQQRSDEALDLIKRALDVAPHYVDAWNNLGNVYKQCGRLAEAEQAYRRAIAVDAGHAGAWNNLGVVLTATRRAAEAVSSLQEAIRLDPSSVDAYFNLGSAFRSCGTLRESIAAYCRVLELDPEHARAHELLGRMLYLAGERAAAASIFRSWADVEPDNPVPVHMLAACSGENVPVRASDAYVRATFDAFADSFDEMLLARLDYRAPGLIAAALAEAVDNHGSSRDVLDAGCGTGLCGPLLKPGARALTGVDLSPRMLAKARARNVYDLLVEAELVSFLWAHPTSFDVVASADTLCYFGDLAPAIDAAAIALRAKGWFTFTVEGSDDIRDYRINPHGRYSHARGYIVRLLEAAQFTAITVTGASLRREAGAPVDGWVVRAQRR